MLTFKQTVAYLNISESTLYRLMVSKKIIGYRIGHMWRFKQAEIDAYIHAHASVATA